MERNLAWRVVYQYQANMMENHRMSLMTNVFNKCVNYFNVIQNYKCQMMFIIIIPYFVMWKQHWFSC